VGTETDSIASGATDWPPNDKPEIRRRLFLLTSTALWLILLALLIRSSLHRIMAPPWGNPQGDGRSPQIARDTRVGQQFMAPYPGLYRIQVWLDPTSATSSRQITAHLRAVPPANTSGGLPADGDPSVIASRQLGQHSVVLHSTELEDGLPFTIEFSPIRDSMGRIYTITFDSPGSTPGDALAAHYSPEARLKGASATVNGQPVPGNLQFATFYSLRARDRVALLLTRLTQGRPYLYGTKGYYVSLALVYALTLTAFLWRVARSLLRS
jgi:hypothetical protein